MRHLDPQDWARFRSQPDEAAFRPLFEATKSLIFTICWRFLHSREDAEEALQGTYARLLVLVRAGDPLLLQDPHRLLSRLAVLEADRIRQLRRRRTRREVAMDPLPDAPIPTPAASALEQAELRTRLEQLVEQLPELYSLPIALHYFHGLTHQQIADAIALPISTVSNQIARGLKKLEPRARRAGLRDSLGVLAVVAGGSQLLDPGASLAASSVFAAASAQAGVWVGPAAAARAGASATAKLLGVGVVVLLVLAGTYLGQRVAGNAAAAGAASGRGDQIGRIGPISPIGLIKQAPQPAPATSSRSAAAPASRATQVAPPRALDLVLTWAEDGKPIANAPLALSFANGSSTTTVALQTDIHGLVRLDNPPREALLELQCEEALDPLRDLRHGEARRQALSFHKGACVFGTVRYADGRPAAGAEVRLVGFSTQTTIAGSDGRWKFSHLAPMKWVGVGARLGTWTSPGDRPNPDFFALAGGDRHGPVELVLAEGGMLAVIVSDEATGNPLPGASVLLMDGTRHFADESGVARFEGLARGEWQMQVLAPGHAMARQTSNLLLRQEGVVEVALAQGGTVVGRVTDAAGTPLAGVKVFSIYSGPIPFAEDRTAFSGADGHYEMGHLSLRGAVVDLTREGYARTRLQDMVIQDADAPLERDVVLSKGESLAGIVLDEDDRPVQGAGIYVGHSDEPSARSGRDGRFRVDAIDPGTDSRCLIVQARGFAARKVDLPPGSHDSRTGVWEAPPETSRPGPPDPARDIKVVLSPGLAVHGRVVDEDGEPIPDVLVAPQAFDRTYLGDSRTQTNAQGRFAVDSLPTSALFDFHHSRGQLYDYRLRLGSPDEQTVVLKGKGILRGHLVDARTGAPVPRFRIKLYNSEGSPIDTWASLEFTRSDMGAHFDSPDGAFRLEDIDLGATMAIAVEAPGYPIALFDHLPVALPSEAQSLELKLDPEGRSVAGTVVDGIDHPLAGADVYVLCPLHAVRNSEGWPLESVLDPGAARLYLSIQKAMAGPDGRFSLNRIPVAVPADLIVVVDGKPYPGAHLDEHPPAEWENLLVNISAGCRIRGTVNRQVFPGKTGVGLWTPPPNPQDVLYQELPASESSFEFRGIPPGRYRVVLGSLGVESIVNDALEVTVEEGGIADVSFGDPARPSLSGRVFIGDKPLASALVSLTLKPGVAILLTARVTRTDGEGRFRFEHLDPGPCTLGVPEGSKVDSNSIVLAPFEESLTMGDKDVERDFHFGGDASLRGRVTGAPAAIRQLWLSRQSSPGDGAPSPRPCSFVPGGRFSWPNLKPGVYSLLALSAGGGDGEQSWVLASTIKLANGQELDLGDIHFPSGGDLKVLVDPTSPWVGQPLLSLCVLSAGTRAGDALDWKKGITGGTISGQARELLLSCVPPGDGVVVGVGEAWIADPVRVVIAAGKRQEATIAPRPVTSLRLHGARADTTSSQPKVVSATLTQSGTGQVLKAEVPEVLSSPMTYPSGHLYFHPPCFLTAQGIAAGRWRAEIVLEGGGTWSQEFDLVPGKTAEGTITADKAGE